MSFFRKNILLAGAFLGLFPGLVMAQNNDFRGELKITDKSVDGNLFSLLKVRYDLSLNMGNPCQKFSFYYTPSNPSAVLKKITFKAQIFSGSGRDAYVTFSPLISSPGTWSKQITINKKWSDAFYTLDGKAVSRFVAKSFYDQKVRLDNLEVVSALVVVNAPQNNKSTDNFSLTNDPSSINKPVTIPVKKVKKSQPVRQQDYSARINNLRQRYRRAQMLGSIKVASGFLSISAWDHSTIDGDRVQITLNEKVVISDLTLEKAPKNIALRLVPGKNIVTVTALNEGRYSPNTAKFRVNSQGQVVMERTWNLKTGGKGILELIYEDSSGAVSPDE